jgi:nitroreductase
LILWQAAKRLTKDISADMCGRIAALLWLSLPAVGLGSFVMSTDSVMLPFWAGALYFVLASQNNWPENNWAITFALPILYGGRWCGDRDSEFSQICWPLFYPLPVIIFVLFWR